MNNYKIISKIYFNLFVLLTKLWFYVLYKGKLNNTENIDELIKSKQSFIIAANHTSYFDWMILYVAIQDKYKQKIHFLAKEKLYKNILLAPLMNVGEAVKVNEDKLSHESLKKLIKYKNSNSIIGIFPEGTRSATGSLLKNSKDGAVKLSLMLDIPLVPVGLTNFHKMWPKNSFLPKLNFKNIEASIHFGNPIKIISGNPKIIIKTPTSNELIIKKQTSVLMNKIKELSYK